MKRILDRSFHYVPSYERARRREAEEPRENVLALPAEVGPMRRLLALVMLVLAAPAYAAQDLDACLPAGAGSMGTVEAVREVPAARGLHAFDAELFEHKIRAETAEQLVVRLDSGPVLIFPPRSPRRLQAGERVRVTLNGAVEREAAYCAMAPLAGLAQRGF